MKLPPAEESTDRRGGATAPDADRATARPTARAAERAPAPAARLFVALDLPAAVRGALGRWGERELVDEALRPVAPEALHITLCFLGSTPQERIPDAVGVVTATEPLPVKVRLRSDPAGLPPKRPGLWVVEAEAPAAVGLQETLAAELVAHDLLEPERRPFWPHVTLARVRKRPGTGGRSRKPRKVGRAPGALPPELTEPFGAVRIALYRSTLRPEGAKYVPLAKLDLPPVA